MYKIMMENDKVKYFHKDEVAMVTPKSGFVKYGLVLPKYHIPQLKTESKKRKSPNKIAVIWHPTGTKKILSDDKVVLMDRTLMLGTVVRKVRDGEPSQFGYCENIEKYATVKILNTNKIIENISYRNLAPTRPFAIDSTVFYELWFGTVIDVQYEVTFVSQDGSIFVLDYFDLYHYRLDIRSLSTSDNYDNYFDYVFYNGKKIKMHLGTIIECAKFINLSNLMRCRLQNYEQKYFHKYSSKWIKVYVQDVTITSVVVDWYAQLKPPSGHKYFKEHNKPDLIITGDNLKKLKSFDFHESCLHFNTLSNTCWYQIKKNDKLITMNMWKCNSTEDFKISCTKLPSAKKHEKKGMSPLKLENMAPLNHLPCKINETYNNMLRRKNRPQGISTTLKFRSSRRYRFMKSIDKKNKQFHKFKMSKFGKSIVVVEICFTKSMIDVVWQDGTKEYGVSSTDLYSVQTSDDHKFRPGYFVTDKNCAPNVYGIIKFVNSADHTARVQWFKTNYENSTLPNLIETTDLSVYDLCHHPYFDFKSGYLVIHIYPGKDPDFNTAGHVVSVGTAGKILVLWDNGEKTKCWPQELFVFKKMNFNQYIYGNNYEEYDDDKNATSKDLYYNPSMSNLCTINEIEQPLPKENVQGFSQVGNEILFTNYGPKKDDKGTDQISYEPIGDKKTKESMLELKNHSDLMWSSPEPSEKEDQCENEDLHIDSMDIVVPGLLLTEQDSTGCNKVSVDIDTVPQCEVIAKPAEGGVFEMVETLVDNSHQYINEPVNMHSELLVSITKDIKILKNSLPAGIWVKNFEDRMDLFSVMIRGPEKTPYYGGLFMFDVKLPHSYPNVPPKCHFYSFTDALNPNLYISGKVCLSLLGTWHGNEMEQWSPKYSNLLQLFVSIQGLILVDEPFYNEPAFESMRYREQGKMNSHKYNGMVVIKVVQSMTRMLKMNINTNFENAKYFKNEILEHVKVHGDKLINNIEKWTKMSEKELTEDEKLDPGFPLLPLSQGHCLSINKELKDFKNVMNLMFK